MSSLPAADKVRVLHFIDHTRIGGPGKTILNCAKYIDRSRFEIHAAFFSDGSGTDLSRAVAERGIPCLALRDRNGFEWSHVRGLAGYIRSNRIDILHTHGYKTDFLGVLQKKINRGPALVTTHHGWIQNSIRQKIYARAGMALSRFFDGVMIVSDSMERFLPLGIRRSGAFTVIHNAIVPEDYDARPTAGLRKQFNVRDDEILVGVIGRLSPEKGCVEMLAAFHELRKCRENLNLVFIGEGGLRGELERMTGELGLRSRVFFTGFLQPVAPVYREIDILICPSRTEGLSNVILEAMACRVPVIATDVGGNAEIISHRRNGILIGRAGADELHGPLRELSANRDFRDMIVRNAYRTVVEKFSFASRMRKEEEFYLNVLARGAGMAAPACAFPESACSRT